MKRDGIHVAPRDHTRPASRRAVGRRLLCCLSALVLCAAPAQAADPADSGSRKWERAIRQFEQSDRKDPPPENAVLFVGSSSIRLWPTADAFPGLPVVNRGFGGSQISDVNHYLPRIVVCYSPRAVVLYAGDNDVAAGKTPVQVARDFRTFSERVHEQLPRTTIVFISIKPSIARWKLWPKMRDANQRIRQLIRQDERLRFADIATPMLAEDGRPTPELFLDDGLHLNERGYAIWNRIVRTSLEELGLTENDDATGR